MKIVVLDAMTLGEDIDLSPLYEQGDVVLFDYTEPDKTAERIKDADIVVTNKVVINREHMEKAGNLKLICVAATGYNNIDIPATLELGIVATNVKGYSTESVAQYVFANLLFVMNSIEGYRNDIAQGQWQKSPVFTLLTHPIYELKGKTLGIIGYGNIGRRVAQIANAFGMNVLVAKRPGVDYKDDFRVDLEYLLKQSDVVSIHTPLTEETKNLITLDRLKMMKQSAILINAARGGIVNEDDLYVALKNRIISYAIVDVLSQEPPSPGCKLFELDNIVITPHIAWTSKEARQKLLDGIVDNIIKFKLGKIKEIQLTS